MFKTLPWILRGLVFQGHANVPRLPVITDRKGSKSSWLNMCSISSEWWRPCKEVKELGEMSNLFSSLFWWGWGDERSRGMENRTRSPDCLSPRRLQTMLWSLHTHSCKFHLVRVVFSCSVLRIHIIQTSYLHCIGFHQHNSYKRFFYSTPVICVEILLRRRETVKSWEECLRVASRHSLTSSCSYRKLQWGKKRGWPKPWAANPHLASSCLSAAKI